MFAYVYFVVPPVYAGEQYKIFEDGVTYISNGEFQPSILYDGKEYDCGYNPIFSYKGYLAPECVEIIIRTSLEVVNEP